METLRQSLHVLRSRPDFRRLLLGDVISWIGDWLGIVAVSLVALDQGEGLLAVAMVLVIKALPEALVSPVAGIVADRVDRRRLLLMGQALLALSTVAMAGAAAAGALLPLQLILLAREAVAAFLAPVQSAALPRVVAVDEVGPANTLHATAWSATFALGMAAGGLLTAWLGPVPAILLDALTFVAAGAVLRGLPDLTPHRSQNPPGDEVRQALSDPALFMAVLARAPAMAISSAGWVLLHGRVHAGTALGVAAVALGLLQAIRAVGMGVGPMLSMSLRATVVWTGVGVVSFALFDHPVLMGLSVLVWGIGTGANWVAATTARQQLASDAVQGRMAAIDAVVSALTTSAAAVGAALLVDATGLLGLAVVPGLVLCALVSGAIRVAQLTASRQRNLHRHAPRLPELVRHA